MAPLPPGNPRVLIYRLWSHSMASLTSGNPQVLVLAKYLSLICSLVVVLNLHRLDYGIGHLVVGPVLLLWRVHVGCLGAPLEPPSPPPQFPLFEFP